MSNGHSFAITPPPPLMPAKYYAADAIYAAAKYFPGFSITNNKCVSMISLSMPSFVLFAAQWPLCCHFLMPSH